jgi:hypothetical protein
LSTSSNPLAALAQAIAQDEGYNVTGSVSQNANNPGNVGSTDIGFGTTTAAGGHQVTNYGSVSDGWGGLLNLLNTATTTGNSNYSPNESLADFYSTYSGGENSTLLANTLGVDPATPISAYAGDMTGALAQLNAASSGAKVGTSGASSTSAAAAAAAAGQQPASQGLLSKYLGLPSLMDAVGIVGGLILIAGAVYGFKNLATTTVNIAKGARETAEVAAA